MAYGQHLKRNRCGTLCFRFVFPPDIRAQLGRTEISIALGTASRKDAELARIELSAMVKRLVLVIRQSGPMEWNEERKRTLLDLVKTAQTKHLVKELTAAERELNLTQQQLDRAAQQRRDAIVAKDAAEQYAAQASEALAKIVIAGAAAARSPRLSEAIGKFTRERQGSEAWMPKTAEKWRHALELVADWFGDRHTSDIDRHELVLFRDGLRRLPRNAGKIAELKNATMREQTESGYPPISATTVNQIMTMVSGFWAWMAKDPNTYHVKSSIATGLKLAKAESEKRRSYSEADLRALFSSVEFSGKTFLHTYMYWALPMTLLTGARINEIAQLGVDDFRTEDGVSVIALCEPGKRAKNRNARRLVPVHPELVRLGLLRHVEHLRASGEAQLFPELTERRDGHGQAVSRWFGKYASRAGIDDRTKVLHSTRNTFITALEHANINELTITRIVGHRADSQSGNRYLDRDPGFKRLAEIVALVDLPAIRNLPPVEDITFGVDLHRKLRKPPSQLGKRRTTRAL